MSLRYAKRMDNIKASEIRELLKLTQKPEIISFAGGLPAPELFPVEELEKVSSKVLEEQGTTALQYGPTEGYEPLRVEITKRMEKVGVECKPEDILVTSGSQQGLDFSGKIFLNPGDIVLCESPSYLGAINAFKAYEPEFIGVPTDENGMIMEELEDILKNNDRVRFIYVIPDFQNPSGRTWSIERRKRLIELANEYNVAIIEDNPYGELRFEGEYYPAIKHYDTEGRVIFLGTFSKIFCPGLRLGWVCAEEEVLNKFVLAKQGSDLQSSTISQMQVAKFLEEYDIEAHIENLKKVYKKRRDLMINTMKEEFPEEIKFTNPEGGLFTWVVLPEYMNARDLAVKAIEKNVAFVPGGSFFPNGGNENTLRLNYSSMDDEKIVIGIKRLAEAIKSMMKESQKA
ncbi:aminotransferase-like domain-containing protein [Anaerosalibacter bizertensis]|uniref:aminotransferase-like domain-containing protein n=1 Tax=Anaerosalibacter bizertensis TaxID=932217 RepID=UPI001C0EAE2D|nr:PLP-dependent aminotransferase family protein [Anaerosalibacter bizertensis]MBU5294326.1 PLP-dependent aminotransferase family protein [Anaerosalibacter bizertensis]MBV1817925.1 PLP-dependent aminotransferase family protein [Bacteroidales bacterium MSK.15.36]MCB5559896.1 PLP-dependent aminotransferase family protein [Anaerosalibacter bizertensis]MCG4585131.1 PLP-dependent aminotransferase family protein [Anaerosalibacter bizertensis]